MEEEISMAENRKRKLKQILLKDPLQRTDKDVTEIELLVEVPLPYHERITNS